MKVLHFFKTYYPDTMGGIEQVIFQLAEGGQKLGIESEVLSLSSRGTLRDVRLGSHITHTANLDLHLASTGFSLSAFKEFRALAANTDIINYHFPWPFMDVVHFSSGIHKPFIVSYHSDIIKQRMLRTLYRPLMDKFLGAAQRIIVSSPNYLATSPILKRHRKKCEIIPIGIDSSTYPVPSPSKLNDWKSCVGERFFLFVGALRYYKGLKFLIDAAALTGLPVVIAGKGPEEAALKAQVEFLKAANVRFVGAVPDEDKAALLSLCQCLVFPSHLRSEAFGISLLEGAMYGKPLISCEIGTGTTYINLHEKTGLVVPPEDPTALASAMRQLWDSPSLSMGFGRNARERYESHFTGKSMLRGYADIYQQVLNG